MTEDNFYSIDHLVEFGLGVNVASQMVKMMNESMQNMHVPGAGNNIIRPDTLYYAIIDDQQTGPFSESEVARLVSEKKISSSTYMWKPGMTSWHQVVDMPDILRLIALMPPAFKK